MTKVYLVWGARLSQLDVPSKLIRVFADLADAAAFTFKANETTGTDLVYYIQKAEVE